MDLLLPVPVGGVDGRGGYGPRHWRDIRRSDPVEIDFDGGEPVTLDEAKAQLQIDADDYDEWLIMAIPAVRRQVEADLNWSLVTSTLEMVFDQFPVERELAIRGPVASVTAITSYAWDGTATVMAPSDYLVDTWSVPGRVIVAPGAVWPTNVRPQLGGKIRWVSGGSSRISERAKHAMRLLLAHWAENREAVTSGTARYSPEVFPMGYDALIGDRVVSFG